MTKTAFVIIPTAYLFLQGYLEWYSSVAEAKQMAFQGYYFASAYY